MDIYGDFQICAIGLVAAPITILLHPAYFKDTGEKGPTSQISEGSNSTASRGNVKIITLIRRVPKAGRYLLFIGTALNILIAGEINFFSPQIRYPNEPMSSICK